MNKGVVANFPERQKQAVTVTIPQGYVSMISFISYPLHYAGHAMHVFRDGNRARDLWNRVQSSSKRPVGLAVVTDCFRFLVVFSKRYRRDTKIKDYKLLFTSSEVLP